MRVAFFVFLSPLALALALLSFSACGRSEQPHALESAHAAAEPLSPPSTEAVAPSPSAAPANSHACVVPSLAEPPPRAAPALHCPIDREPDSQLARGYVLFNDAPGSPRLSVELARSEPEKERGLMFRTKMPDEQGMLFSWDDEQPRTFWMHNTCIPLDMLFIARDGTIAGILEQVPTLNDEPRGIPCPAAYVLEVNAGWARSHGVKSGTVLHFE
jgi:uncharacterized membrane protein (UPF0127 family)